MQGDILGVCKFFKDGPPPITNSGDEPQTTAQSSKNQKDKDQY